MCGIIGYVGNAPCAKIILEGLQQLEYRGYDSSGIALIENGDLKIFKEKGVLENLCKEIDNGNGFSSTIGIGHTRWATHGKASKENAHPHISNNGKFAVVHNGIIENYLSIRTNLIAKGYNFVSQTDTEIIAVLLEDNDCGDVLKTIKKTADILEGSYALGVLCQSEAGKLFCVKKSSPLIVGVGEDACFIASDATPLIKHTRNVYQLNDGEIGVLEKRCLHFFDKQLNPVEKEIVEIKWNVEVAEKNGYDHFMIKEIFEQPNALRNTLMPKIINNVFCLNEIKLRKSDLRRINKIFIVGCGSAYHVGIVGKYVVEKFTKIAVEVDVASEFRYRNPIVNNQTLCIFVSQSGETADTLAALRHAKSRGGKTLSIVNVVGSTIAKESDSVIYTQAGAEISVATTKAYSTQMALLFGVGIFIGKEIGAIADELYEQAIQAFRKLPSAVEKVLQMNNQISKLAQRYAFLDHAYFLGRNLDYGIALEASLKLKEISYIHSEAYPAGELKHGTISLVEEGTFVVALLCGDDLIEKTLSNIKEVRARGAEVLSLTTDKHMATVSAECDHVITVPEFFKYFMPLVEVVPMQLLGYHIAKARNCDIDKPRNLAKSVTVE